jgi:hypothetical protein
LLPTSRSHATCNLWRSLINRPIFPGYGAFVPAINLYCCFVPLVTCAAFGLLALSSVFRFYILMLIVCCIWVLVLAL